MAARLEQREHRVVMARQVAMRWLAGLAQPEYRFDVLYGAKRIRNLPNLLRSFRDRKASLEGVPAIADLGVRENGDSISLWSGNREQLQALQGWFEKRGFETTGVW